MVGEIDLLSYSRLQTALDTALFDTVDEPTRHLVVDLAGVSFCCVRGLALLADTARSAAENATGYALSGCPTHLERHWPILIPHLGAHIDVHATRVRRYASAAAAVTAILAEDATGHPPSSPGSRQSRQVIL